MRSPSDNFIGEVASLENDLAEYIMKTDPVSGSGGGGDVPSASGGAAPPSPTGIGGESLIPSQLTEQLSDTGTQPVQAYVVETDISESQALQQELDLQTTL